MVEAFESSCVPRCESKFQKAGNSKFVKMQNADKVPVKEIVVKRISASKFEVYEETQPPSVKSEGKEPKLEERLKPPEVMQRESVIQRAPPAIKNPIEPNVTEEAPSSKKRKTGEGDGSPMGVILIRDAIMYRIIDILMWKVMGENQLKSFGYPSASTHQILWRVVNQKRSLPGATKQTEERPPKEHDCGGNPHCFANHVHQFLEMCAPVLRSRVDWGRHSVEDILRKIYYEDLIPYLRNLDLRNNLNVLQCHSDIILLEKWERQKFTAVTWSGQKYLSQMSFNCPKCPQCSNRHF